MPNRSQLKVVGTQIANRLSEQVFGKKNTFQKENFITSISIKSPDGLEKVLVEFYKGAQLITCRELIEALEENSVGEKTVGKWKVTRWCRRIVPHDKAVRELCQSLKKRLMKHQAKRELKAHQGQLISH